MARGKSSNAAKGGRNRAKEPTQIKKWNSIPWTRRQFDFGMQPKPEYTDEEMQEFAEIEFHKRMLGTKRCGR